MDAHGYWRNLPGLWVIKDEDKQVEEEEEGPPA
jgi:hypoxanthine phosphoribosyltransferase